MTKVRYRLCVLVLLGTVGSAGAALDWEREEQEIKVHPVQLSATAVFPFTNTGSTSVEILKTDVSCGCLVPKIGKKTYQPGESGEIKVEFLLRGRTGKQRKQVLVTTSANPTVPYRLQLAVDIPDGYVLSTKRLLWERTPEHAPQTCRLTNVSGEPIELGEILPTVSCIKARLLPVKTGYVYDLVVSPDAGVENLRAYVLIKTIPPAGMDVAKDYKVYIFIK